MKLASPEALVWYEFSNVPSILIAYHVFAKGALIMWATWVVVVPVNDHSVILPEEKLALSNERSRVPPDGVSFSALSCVVVLSVKKAASGIALTVRVEPEMLSELACELEAAERSPSVMLVKLTVVSAVNCIAAKVILALAKKATVKIRAKQRTENIVVGVL